MDNNLAVLLLRYAACLNLNILIYKRCVFGDTYPVCLQNSEEEY